MFYAHVTVLSLEGFCHLKGKLYIYSLGFKQTLSCNEINPVI